MDKYEKRRISLNRLRTKLGYGGIAKIATEIGVEPNYVSRMLYPEGKAGKKRIGEDSVEKLNEKFPGWLGIDQARTMEQLKQVTGSRRGWPFSIPFENYEKLSADKKNQLNDKVVAFIEGALPADAVKRPASA